MPGKTKTKNKGSSAATDLEKDAELAVNSLAPSQPIEKATPKRAAGKRADRVPSAPEVVRADAARTADKEPRAIPQSIRERFIGVGSEYYFPDGAVAFRDHGGRLTTPSENTEVVRSLVEIAQARGWNDITVRGTERFRKEAWFVASLVGIEVKGYEPTEFERQRMIRALARRDGYAGENDVAVRGDGTPSREVRQRPASDRTAESHAAAKGDQTRGDGRGVPQAPSRDADSASFTGRLVDHGEAPYHHDRKEAMSYFVRVETPSGDKEIWGVDLERAINKSLTRPAMGDQVTVRAVGREPVTIMVEKHDEAGRFMGTDEVQTYRNRWAVEKAVFMAERAAAAKMFRNPAITPEEGAKRHPELQGTYLQLQVARSLAQGEIADPTERQRFVDRTREALAQSIEAGEPLQTVLMKDRGRDRVEGPRMPEQNMDRVR